MQKGVRQTVTSLAAILGFVTTVHAGTITYDIAGNGLSGLSSGISFQNGGFNIHLVADSDAVQFGSNYSVIDPLISATISIASLPDTTLLIPTRLGFNIDCSCIFWSRSGSGGIDLFDFQISLTDIAALNSGAITGPLIGGPVVGGQFLNVATTGGLDTLNFHDVYDLQFSAPPGVLFDFPPGFPVPGPAVGAGLPGLVLAFGGALAWWRRRRA